MPFTLHCWLAVSAHSHGELGLKIVQVSFGPAYNKKIHDIKLFFFNFKLLTL